MDEVSDEHHKRTDTLEESLMKAMRFHEFGSSEVLRYEDVDRPVPGPGQVLVRVAATSFNPVDDHIRAGVLAEMIPITLPYVPGIDLAGTVAELGADVTGLQVGDRVVAMLPLDSAGGAAEYALAPAESLARAPQATLSTPRRCRWQAWRPGRRRLSWPS
jgi:NADPH:quinone reductase-like Zn-dependent oxidoreductase